MSFFYYFSLTDSLSVDLYRHFLSVSICEVGPFGNSHIPGICFASYGLVVDDFDMPKVLLVH